jgi:hypothetical protein
LGQDPRKGKVPTGWRWNYPSIFLANCIFSSLFPNTTSVHFATNAPRIDERVMPCEAQGISERVRDEQRAGAMDGRK